jgi:hypothetical protein
MSQVVCPGSSPRGEPLEAGIYCASRDLLQRISKTEMLGHRLPRLIVRASIEAEPIGSHLGPQLAGWGLAQVIIYERTITPCIISAMFIQSECCDDPLQT